MQYQSTYRQNEAQGRYIAETLNLRVTWWSAAQALVIIFTGIGQIILLKCFFTETRLRTPAATDGISSHPAVLPMRP